MKTIVGVAFRVLALAALFVLGSPVQAQADPLPSWDDDRGKEAIVELVQSTMTNGGPKVVPSPRAAQPSPNARTSACRRKTGERSSCSSSSRRTLPKSTVGKVLVTSCAA